MSHDELTITLDTYLAEPLCHDLGVLEDWLLHASPEVRDELAEFAYHDTGQAQACVTDLITDLGRYQVALHRLLRALPTQR